MRNSRRELVEAFERNSEALDRHEAAFNDLRTFTRDLTRRNEVVWREVVEELREGRKALADMGEQVRANTQAILSVLDRLNNGGSAGAG